MTLHDLAAATVIVVIGALGTVAAVISEAGAVALGVAVITTVGAVASAHAATAARRDVAARIGTPNGSGDVVEMLERILAGQTGQDTRLASHDDRLARLEGSVDAIRRDCHLIRDTEAATAERVHDIARGVGVTRRHHDEEAP